MQIVLIEPFFGGSHASWARGVQKYSSHKVSLLTLPGRSWKWRMHGASVTLAREYLKLSEELGEIDLLIATDMLDLSTFLALTRVKTATTPILLYFHENQLSYPWSPRDKDIELKRDLHYGFINYTSSLSAARIAFNSSYNFESFTEQLDKLLNIFPDYKELQNVDLIRSKSRVLPLGIELEKFDEFRPAYSEKSSIPLILWNHRWEYDKNPDEFFKALYELAERGVEFQIAILGESYKNSPKVFKEAKERLKSRVVKFGYAETFSEYAEWLWRADFLPVTSFQEFFGISIMEAVYCECLPILPKRLTYPDLFHYDNNKNLFYSNYSELVVVLEELLVNFKDKPGSDLRNLAASYCWSEMIGKYDEYFEHITKEFESV